MQLHPITYSLVMNVIVLAVAGGLAFAFAQPLVFILAILVSNHALERFRNDRDDDDDDLPGPPGAPSGEYDGGSFGFVPADQR